MDISEAKRLGGRVLLKSSVILFLLYELAFLIIESKGDFANGILYFFESQENPYFIIFVCLSFLWIYLIGRRTGYKVIIVQSNRTKVILLHAFLATTLILFNYSLVIMAIYRLENISAIFSNTTYVFKYCILGFVIIFIPSAISWLWATDRLKKI